MNAVRSSIVIPVALLSLVTGGAVMAQPSGMTFFVTSVGVDKGADFGGLDGADRHCQTLAAAAGNASEGLRLTINGGSLGARGTVNFSRGYADQVNTLINGLLSNTGPLQGRTDGLNRSIGDIEKQRTAWTV